MLAAGGAVLGALVVLQGCSSSSSDSAPAPTGPENPTYADKSPAISSNHGHSYTLTAAQQEAGAEVQLFTRGGDHSHKIRISAADVASIAAGNTWTGEDSLSAGHTHMITFN